MFIKTIPLKIKMALYTIQQNTLIPQVPQLPLEQEVDPNSFQQSESDDLPESSPDLIRQNAQIICPALPVNQ